MHERVHRGVPGIFLWGIGAKFLRSSLEIVTGCFLALVFWSPSRSTTSRVKGCSTLITSAIPTAGTGHAD